ncbi:unnamed protein product [Adineta ricciae]|uniref:Uncharacterized protein n=1 Tax=Adineta ricciae TaxID=249248 RepID=A0A814G0D1_ADIRI|nr:unnamed protein product [Adineta ricciae]CAF1440092.1 unnamed protein product [Adineta ricciae]
MGSMVLRLLTLALGIAFIFFGQLHITPQFFREQHDHIKNEYGKFNKEFPFHRQTGWRPYAKNYRLTVGITEIVCGTCLLLGILKTPATIVLMMLMTNALITFQKLNYGLDYIGSVIFMLFLLVIRLVLASKSKVQSVAKKVTKKME